MKYQHQFSVVAPLARVAEFHRQAASMPMITPPPIVVRVHQAPPVLNSNDIMRFTLWLGPLPVRWVARMENISPTGFVDRQLRGPFRQWVHQHRFEAIDANTTAVIDEIAFDFRPHPVWGPIGWSMALGLPILFAYRAWRTRQLLTQAVPV